MLRGAFVMAAVGVLMFVGVLVGGIQVCDAQRNPVAGMVQRGSLPGVILNVVASQARPDGTTMVMGEYGQAVVDNTGGKPEEIGLIFTAVAGFLNLMAIVGSLTPLPKEIRPSDESEEGAGSDRGVDAGVEKTAPQGGQV